MFEQVTKPAGCTNGLPRVCRPVIPYRGIAPVSYQCTFGSVRKRTLLVAGLLLTPLGAHLQILAGAGFLQFVREIVAPGSGWPGAPFLRMKGMGVVLPALLTVGALAHDDLAVIRITTACVQRLVLRSLLVYAPISAPAIITANSKCCTGINE